MPSQKKKCKSDEILNNETNRCVKKSGKIGKKIIKELKELNKKSKKKVCKDDEILNPESNRCVKRSGIIGKRLVETEKNKLITKTRRHRRSKRRSNRSNRSNSIVVASKNKIIKPTIICEKGKILNPKTNRCVRINGPIGRSIRDKINNIKEIVKELIQESNSLTMKDIKKILRERNIVFEGYGLKDIIIDTIDEILKENVTELLENDDIITRKDLKRELDKRNVIYNNQKLKNIINEITNDL